MKKRLDVLLFERGLMPSREKSRAVIMAGSVYVNGMKADKAGMSVDESAEIEVRGPKLRYVSRGGLKLEKAVDVFGLELEGMVCIDVGSSTGGFTDCMLQNGAVRVYAIDVGRGQLDWKLRNDPRVVVMERTNIRYVTEDDIPEKADFASVDVSFISLTKVLGPLRALIKPGACAAVLIKPQFEAGREKVEKHGVVRDPAVHAEVIRKVAAFAAETGFDLLGLSFSPVKGPEGNIEYLLLIRKSVEGADGESSAVEDLISGVVEEAHAALDEKRQAEEQ